MTDIYIVADAEGKEMVLKLHRYPSALSAHSFCSEPASVLIDLDEYPFERSRKSAIIWASESLHLGCTCPVLLQKRSGPS